MTEFSIEHDAFNIDTFLEVIGDMNTAWEEKGVRVSCLKDDMRYLIQVISTVGKDRCIIAAGEIKEKIVEMNGAVNDRLELCSISEDRSVFYIQIVVE